MSKEEPTDNANGPFTGDIDEYEEWVTGKFKLFTIIGVFGALAVYLTRLPGESSLFNEAGIAGCLIIFLILSLIIIFDGIEKTIDAMNQVSLVLFLYLFTAGGLIGAVMAVTSTLQQYWEGTVPLAVSVITVGAGLIYIGFFFINNPFEKVEWEASPSWVLRSTPYIALILTFGFVSYGSLSSTQGILDIDTWGSIISAPLILILLHLFLTISIVTGFAVSEFLTVLLPKWVRGLRSDSLSGPRISRRSGKQTMESVKSRLSFSESEIETEEDRAE